MEILFIQGPEKTATSTITGILNCHPEIFVLFENYLAQPIITKYGNRLLSRYPEARKFYRTEEDYGKPVRELFEYLKEREPEYRYRYIGTKVNSLDAGFTQKVREHKIIFMMRDLRSWLIKESIIKYYRTDLDVVVPAVEYLRYILETHLYTHAARIRMEDLILQNEATIGKLSEFLKLELFPHSAEWWDKIGNWDEKDPKSVFKLNQVHHSSRMEPEKLDSEVELTDHPFWEEALELFDTYYFTDEPFRFNEDKIKKDLVRVDKLLRYSPLPFTDMYKEVHSVRRGFSQPREFHFQSDKGVYKQERSLKKRLSHRLKKIVKAAID